MNDQNYWNKYIKYKNKYINIIMGLQKGGTKEGARGGAKYEQDGKTYSGAGVLLVKKSRNNKYEDTQIILFGHRYHKMFFELGGTVEQYFIDDEKDTLKLTASNEAREESYGLVKIDVNKIKDIYVDILYKKNQTFYRGFIVALDRNKKMRKNYFRNRNSIRRLSANSVPKHWKETSNIAKFRLGDLFNCGIKTANDRMRCKDIYGKERTIHRRTVQLIRESDKNNKIKEALNNITNFNNTLSEGNDHHFLKGTSIMNAI